MLQIFYIIFLICLILLLVSVILLLIPKNTGDNQNQTALEENILLWTYSKVESVFKDAAITFDFSQASAVGIGDIRLSYKTDYDYPLDSYYPTYEDRTHVHDLTKVASDDQTPNDNSYAPHFLFSENSLPLADDLQAGQCLRVKYEWNGIRRELEGMPECARGGRGLTYHPVRQNVTNLASRCSNTTLENCRRMCAEGKGILEIEGTGYNCYTVQVAKAICVKVEVKDNKLKLAGGCFYNGQLEYFGTLDPSTMWKYGRTVDFLHSDHDGEGSRGSLCEGIRAFSGRRQNFLQFEQGHTE